VVVEREANGTNKTTPGRGGRSLLKKDLTGPTLLEMSGNPTYQELRFLYLFIREWNLQEPGPSWN
jgi:hypothetical protein